nr:MAG TPA: hypothetical protein [Caudoviricetes sp.]
MQYDIYYNNYTNIYYNYINAFYLNIVLPILHFQISI